MSRPKGLARLRRVLVIAAWGAVCVFVGAWALRQLGAPVGAGYALVFAFTAAGVWADQQPLSHSDGDFDSAAAPPPRRRRHRR